ncbi:MAG: helicase-associated domain-containing protein [Chloroflexota bacterium]|nr:helicase-associated domain-containing protein [Chloroflexota bacterium]
MERPADQVFRLLLSFLERYGRPFLQGMGHATGYTARGIPNAHDLAMVLSQPSQVKSLYEQCGAAERRLLLYTYLCPGRTVAHAALWNLWDVRSPSYGRDQQSEDRDLLLKGLLLVQRSDTKPIGLPGRYSSISGDLRLNPLVEPLLRQEKAEVFASLTSAEPSSLTSIHHRVRERELYRLLQRLADKPLPLTQAGRPRQRELVEMAKELSLDVDLANWLIELATSAGLLIAADDAVGATDGGRAFLREGPAQRLRRLGWALCLGTSRGYHGAWWGSHASTVAIACGTATLLPPHQWVAISDVGAWMARERLPNQLVRSLDSISAVWAQVLHPLGWVDLGYSAGDKKPSHIRLTPAGAVALGALPDLPQQGEATGRALIVKPDLEMVVTLDMLDAAEVTFLHAFADGGSGEAVGVYKLSREGLYRAVRGHRGLDDVLSFLETKSDLPLPENVRRTLEGWWAEFQGIRVWEDVDVLEEDGEFRIRDGEAPGAPVVDYRAPTVGGARWRAGSLWLDGGADIFLKGVVGAIAVW